MLKVVVDLLLSPLFFQIMLVLPICCASLGGETGFHFSQNYTDQTDADFFSANLIPLACRFSVVRLLQFMETGPRLYL